MKKVIACLAALAAVCCLPSCAITTGPDGSGGFDVIEVLAGPAATYAATTVLDKKVSEEDREEKARILTSIADDILTLTDDNVTGADLQEIVLARAGTKPHWVALGLTLSALYDRYQPRFADDRATNLIRAIAAGLKAGAAPWLPQS